MKPRQLQLGMRENPAPSRQHGSRFAGKLHSEAATVEQEAAATQQSTPQGESLSARHQSPPHGVPHRAATVGESTSPQHLLTVREVAALLQVPVSWVYGRMRKRSSEQLPAYRMGKYWRFRGEEILGWIQRHKRGAHVA